MNEKYRVVLTRPRNQPRLWFGFALLGRSQTLIIEPLVFRIPGAHNGAAFFEIYFGPLTLMWGKA